MNKELFLLIKKDIDILVEQTKTRPQETFEFQLRKQVETFSFNPPINIYEESKWFVAVRSFQAMNSVFNKTDENNSFSINIPGHWQTNSAEKTFNELNKLLELRSQNCIELHVKQVRKRRKQKKMETENKICLILILLKKLLEELRNVEYDDLEYMVFRLQLTYSEIDYILDVNMIMYHMLNDWHEDYRIFPTTWNIWN